MNEQVKAKSKTHKIWYISDVYQAAGLPQGTECLFLPGWIHRKDSRYELDYVYFRGFTGFDYNELKDELYPVQTVGALIHALSKYHPDTPLGLQVYGHTYYSFAHCESHGALKLIHLKFKGKRLRTLMISVGDMRNVEHDCYGAQVDKEQNF